MNSAIAKQLMVAHWAKKGYAVHTEMALNKAGSLRADVLAISMRNEIIIIECKSSVSDFRTDKKWHRYKDYSTKLYFCMSTVTYRKVKTEIPKDVGVFVVDKTGQLWLEGRSSKRDICAATLLDITTRMAFRNSSVQRYKLKSLHSGATLIAKAVGKALDQSDPIVLAKIRDAIQPLV
jgi:hypothetical protein